MRGIIYILDRTFKLKYRNFHIILRNSKKKFLARGVQEGRGVNIFIVFIIRDRTFKRRCNYFHCNQINSKKSFFFNKLFHIHQIYFLKFYISLKTSIETNSSSNLSKFLLKCNYDTNICCATINYHSPIRKLLQFIFLIYTLMRMSK